MRNAGSLVRQTVEIVYKVPFLELLRNKHMITYFLLSNSALFVKLPRRRNLWTRNSVKYSTVHSEQNDRDKTAWKPYGPFCVPSIVTSTDLVQIMLSDSLHWTFKWSLWSFHCVLDNVQCTMTHANAFHPDQSVFFHRARVSLHASPWNCSNKKHTRNPKHTKKTVPGCLFWTPGCH